MLRKLMRRFVAYIVGRQRVSPVRGKFHSAARDVIGPTGNMFSNGWDVFEENQSAYLKSFDPRIPPSTFVSERDLRRTNHAVPMVERCIEDFPQDRYGSQPTT